MLISKINQKTTKNYLNFIIKNLRNFEKVQLKFYLN